MVLGTRGDVRDRASCGVYLTDSEYFEFLLLRLLLRLHLSGHRFRLQAFSVVEQVGVTALNKLFDNLTFHTMLLKVGLALQRQVLFFSVLFFY